MRKLNQLLRTSVLACAVISLPFRLMAGPVTIQIDASKAGAAPEVKIFNSENYNVYVGPLNNVQAIEWGAVVNLLGVDNYYDPGSVIPDLEWRFTDPKAPNPDHAALFIVWIDHDFYGPFWSGDLRIGFNEKKPGQGYYGTRNNYPISTDWLTLYSDDTLVLQFKGSLPKKGQGQ